MPALQAGGHRFEPDILHHLCEDARAVKWRSLQNSCIVGSNPTPHSKLWVVPRSAVCKTVGIIRSEVASWSVTITTHHIEAHHRTVKLTKPTRLDQMSGVLQYGHTTLVK